MTTPAAPERSPAPLVTPAASWLVGVLVGAHFLQWTVFTADAMQGVFAFQRGDLDAGRW